MDLDRRVGLPGWVKLVLAVGIGVAVVMLVAAAIWLLCSAPPLPRPAAGPLAATPPVPSPAPVVTTPGVYVADLASGVRPPEFSAGDVRPTKKGQRPLLGRFDRTGVTFTLDPLPTHEAVHLVMDLVLLNSWNGSSPIWGPDVVSCDEAGGRHLFAATFCNCGFFNNNNEQTFPDVFPAPDGATPHPAWTGAAEKEDLGEIHHFANSQPEQGDCSSVYHLDWTFPHSGPTLGLRFTEQVKNRAMRFGFLGFRAEAVARAPRLSDAEVQSAWADLGDDDPVKANGAVWRLAAAGSAVVPFVTAQIGRPAPPSASPYRPGRIEHLMQVLGVPPPAEPGTGTP